jgi:hypothetical protein
MNTIVIKTSFPEVLDAIDPSVELTTSAKVIMDAGEEYLIVTQVGEDEGGILRFLIKDGRAVINTSNNVLENEAALLSAKSANEDISCEMSTLKDHRDVYEFAKKSVGKFSSKEGPGGGVLACVWAVRNLVHQALGRWVTHTDGTAVFTDELKRCFIESVSEAQIAEGGIIISPTQGRNIGHVGILGPSTMTNERLVYSNSSRTKVWSQNRTLDTWRKYYSDEKKLPVLFFPMPHRHS